jgi:hypothetical protein
MVLVLLAIAVLLLVRFLCRVEIDRVSVLQHQEQVGVGQFELAPLLAAKTLWSICRSS